MAGFETHASEYEAEGVRLVALSADGEDGARRMKEEEGLGFPVLFGLDVDDMHDRLGLYVERENRIHLQPAQFILDPEGRIRLASYSSGPVGRLNAEDALEEVEKAKA